MSLTLIKSSVECPNLTPYQYKDDSTPFEQVGFTLMFVYGVLITMVNATNIHNYLSSSNTSKELHPLFLNIFMMVVNISYLFVFGDGLVSLIVEGGYLNLRFYYIFQIFQLYSFQMILTLSWYRWAPLLLVSNGYEKSKVNKVVLVSVMVFIVGFTLQMVDHLSDYIGTDICYVLENSTMNFDLDEILFLIGIFLNGSIFIWATFSMASKLEAIYKSEQGESLAKIKRLAFVATVGGVYRVLHDLLRYTPYYFIMGIEEAGNDPNARFIDQFFSVLIYISNQMFCYLLPTTFLLQIFVPNIQESEEVEKRKSTTERSLSDLEMDKTLRHSLGLGEFYSGNPLL